MSANHRPLKFTLVVSQSNCTCLAIADYVMSEANIGDTANNNVVAMTGVAVVVVVVVAAAVVLVVAAVVVAWTALIPVRTRIVQSVEQATAPLDINDEYDELGDEDDSCCLSNATMLMLPAS